MNSRSFLRESVLLLMLLMAYVSVWSQGGNNCATAGSSPVALPFFTNNQTLCGALNDYTGTNSCLSNLVNGSPFGGQDWLYAVTPTQSGFLSIVLNDIHATGSVRPIIAVFEGCAGVGPCVTTIQGNVNNGVSTIVPVVAGLTYYIVVDASSSTNNNAANCYQYDLALNLSPNAVQPSCSNMGFESGNFSSWVTTTGNSVTAAVGAPTPIYQLTGLGVVNGRHTIMTGGTDPCGGFSCVDPLGGTSSVRIGNSNTGAEAEMISQTFIVSQSNSSFTYRYAVVFEDPGHTSAEQPFFIARLRAQDGTVIPCSEFIVSAAADLPGFFNSLTCAGVRYKPWSTVNVDLSNYLGQNVTVEFTAGDCSQGGHFGYAYVDASCAPSTLAALADTICPGQSVTLTAPSGYESFNWMPGNLTSQTITVSPAVSTTYTLNLTAFNGCVSAVQVPITIAPIPVPVIQYQAPACDLPVQVQSASTIASGSITSQQWTFTPSGTPGTSAQPVVNVVYPGPGSYPVSLQVTSDQGCTASATQNVVVPPCVFHIAISGDTICPGECLTFPVALSFGVAPYTYSWSNGSTASSITLCSNQTNIISLTVTDATGAVATDTAMVTVVPGITFQPSITNVLCNGGATASINPGAQGWGPFAYSWSNASTAASLSSIAAGNYSVTVTDNFGCPGDTTFLISQPAVLTTTLTIQPATCAQSNGVITVNPPSGGTAPYEFAIDGGVYSSFAQFTGLTVGTHSISVRDANGCLFSVSGTINMSSYPTQLSMQLTDATCGLDNGVIAPLQVTGGVGPFQLWVNGANMGIVAIPISFSNLPAGPFNVELTDANGCMIDTNVTLQQLASPSSMSFTTQPATCGLSNASLSIGTITGGSPAYQYSFNGGAYSSQVNYSNLAAGTVTLSVMDQHQCVLDTVAILPSIQDVALQANVLQNVLCFGGNTGHAAAVVSSGSAPFSFVWTNGDADSLAFSLTAGTWDVVVTDAHNCKDTATVIITQPLALTASLSTQAATCGLNNGSLSVQSPSGGTPAYAYALDGQAPTALSTFASLGTGAHQVIMHDANGCSLNLSASISMLSYPTALSLTAGNATCGQTNGTVQIQQITGGIAPFQLSFNGSEPGQITLPFGIANVASGQNTVLVIDANGCQIDSTISVTQLNGPTAIQYTVQPATCGLNNASVQLGAVSGGNPGYQYSFNGGTFGNQTSFTQVAAGMITLVVQDQHQCQLDTLISVTAIPDVEVAAVLLQNAQCYGSNDGQAAAQIVSGTAPYTYLWTNSDSDSLATTLQAGSWNVYVTDAQNCKDTATVVITEPALLDMSLSYINPRCALTNGQISVASLSGGTAPYHYQLNGGVLQGASTFSLLDVGSYTLQAVDAHGCSVARQAQLAMPSYPTNMTLQKQDAVCGLPNGIARLMQIQGGIAPYQVQWQDTNFQYIQQLPFVLENLAAGSYPIQIRDANGCLVDSASTILQLLGPSQMQVQVQPATCATSNAQIQLMNVVGGSPSYTYSFNNGTYGNQQVFSNLSAGQYTLSVRDMNGCAIDSIIPVTAIPTVQAEPFITHPITCYGFSDGALQLDIQQGTAPYTVNWLNGPTGIASNNLVAGYYQVSITDGQGCTQTTGIQLNQPDPVVVHVTGPAYVCENEEAQLIASASGGTSHVNVTWPEFSVDGDTLIHHPTSTRVYTAIATDILGCAASDSHTVMLRLRPQGNISTSVAEGCSPVCANFTVNSTGTSTLAAFSWNFSNGETSSNQQQQICFTEGGLQDASVILVDEYGCTNTLTAEGIVNVFPLPDARFSYNPNTADIVQPEYQFIQESLLASTFQWTFGDGQTSTLASPLHTFPDTGSFTACLRVTSIHGCVDQVCKKVEIDPFPTIYAPNAFTPNGDGTNEVFMIKVTYATKFFLEIFNRWGELIYQGSDPLEGWDGTYKGNRCQEDVYVWRATISNSEKLNKQMIGRVSLID